MPKKFLGYLDCTNAPFSRNKAVMITPKTGQRNQKAHTPALLRLAWAQVLANQARKATDHRREIAKTAETSPQGTKRLSAVSATSVPKTEPSRAG
jgi:hypothetical protein